MASSSILLANPTSLLGKAVEGIENPHHPLLRLNWNENPLGPPQSAIQAITQALQEANRYPDAKINELKQTLAQKHGVSNEEIMITAGSTELLSLLGQHVGLQKGEILTAWPSFPTIIRFGELCGASIKKVDINKQGVIDLQALKDGISDRTSLVFVCNPNNPPSTEVDHQQLISFCESVPGNILICVDEAYIEYSRHGSADRRVRGGRWQP